MAKKIGNSQAAREVDVNESSIRDWKKKLEGPTKAIVQAKRKKSYNEHEKDLKTSVFRYIESCQIYLEDRDH